ncbi:DUF1700 domain-containing protein [Clostridium sp. AN503]|uniref:DUF1700 domain-containing protein n=1 Tax=Clostridium sp. AN503 TaxID=3160598 RepID=UPI0034588A4B
MNRAEFMKELEYLLQDIPEEDKEEALAYYRDYLEEAGDENEEQVMREFGSPERVAAIIRSDLIGNLEDGGAFTESGYQDERFKDPNFQVVKHQELPEVHEAGTGGASGSSGNAARQRRPGGQDDWLKRLFKVGALLIVLAVAAPILLGIGGGVLGLAGGLLGIAVVVVIFVGLLTVGACVGAVALLVIGVGMLFAHPAAGVLMLGLGVLSLGLGLIGVALSVLVYGRFLPYCIRGTVNVISRFLHGGRRKQA